MNVGLCPRGIGRFLGNLAVRVVLSAAIVSASLASAGAQAQSIDISIYTYSACDSRPLGNVGIQLNGQTYVTNALGEGSATKLPPNSYQARASAPGLPSGKVAYVLFAEANQSGQQRYAADAAGIARFNPGNGGLLMVYMGACGAKTIKVKIATTKSCTDKAGTGFSAQGGVLVKLGTLTFTSNANGVIEADVPPGTYMVNAGWKDYAFAYIAENGLRQKPDESGRFSVRLTDPGETLEIRMLTCDPDGQPKARATIFEIGQSRAGPGSVKVVRSRASGKGFVGMKLRDGDVVTINGTGKLKWLQGGGTISFDDPRGTLLVIGPDVTPAGNKAPDTSHSVLQILQGVGEFLIPPDENSDARRDANGNIIRFGASSQTIAVGIKGTQFRFGYDPQSQTSTVVVEQGTVWVTPKNASLKPFTLQAGQQVAVTQNRVGPITAAGAAQNRPPPVISSAAAPASFGQTSYQAGQHDPGGRITVEAANISPFTCRGNSFYLYQYVNRAPGQPSFRAIRPPDFAHPVGGKDFATRDQAVAAACS
jgi:hypothetical protein